MPKNDMIVGLDIGTTKVGCMVGELVGDPSLINIIGLGVSACSGVKKGVIVNMDSTVESITEAVEKAEIMAGREISSVYVGIAGGHIQSFNSTGRVQIQGESITEQDVRQALNAGAFQMEPLPPDREMIHLIPQEFRVDQQGGIRDPIGMIGKKLEAKIHLVTGAVSSAQNSVRAVNKAGLSVAELCLEPLASAEAVLCQDEKDLGVLLVDMGGGTSDIAIFKNGVVVHTGVLPIGGNHMTMDLAVALRTAIVDAEKIKIQFGTALASRLASDEKVEVPGVGGRKASFVSRKSLAEVIEPRVEEILTLIHQEVVRSGYKELLSAGLVLTGGASLLEGVPEFAELIFQMPVKRGIPQNMGGLREVIGSPKFATGVGLIRYGAKQSVKEQFALREKNIYNQVRVSMRNWMKSLF